MFWRSLFTPVMLLAGLTASAASLDGTLAHAARLLESGQPVQALQQCHEARVDHPESTELLFVIGCAEAAVAEQLLLQRDREKARAQFEAARGTFFRAAAGNPLRFGAGAAYNAATCRLRQDETFDPAEDYGARVENLNAAVDEYVALLETAPKHEKARKNLDHARYKLSRLLQNPPVPKDTPEEEAGDEPGVISEVQSATTEIPNATTEVIDGNTVVLRLAPNGEAMP